MVLDDLGFVHGWEVLAQVKVSQVIDKRPGDVSVREWDYATRAVFDFVACDANTMVPEFAIELDDLSHLSADGLRRDAMKNRLCEADNFELLRVEMSSFEPGPRGRRIIEYLLDARRAHEAFTAAQDAGNVPADEIFDFGTTISVKGIKDVWDSNDPGQMFPNELGRPTVEMLWKAYGAGLIARPMTQPLSFEWRSGSAEAWAWVRPTTPASLPPLVIVGKAKVRAFTFRAGITPRQLAEDLAVVALGSKFTRWQAGEAEAQRAMDVQADLQALLAQQSEMLDSMMLRHARFA